MALWLVYLLPDPVAVGSIPSVPKNFQRKKLPDFLRLIISDGLRKVNSVLKMLIKPF